MKPSSNSPNHLRLGLFGLMSLIILIFGLLYLKNQGLFQKGRTFYVAYDDISGLIEGDPILFNGFHIGRVKKCYLSDNNVMVQLRITEELQISKDSKFQIVNSDLLGSKAVKLLRGSGLPAADGDTLLGVTQKGVEEEIREQLGEDFVPELFDRLEKWFAPEDTISVK